MNRPTHLNPKNPLAGMIGQPGGITVGEALARAGKRVDDLREPALKRIDEALAEMKEVLDEQSALPSEQALSRAYALANQIVGLSGAAQRQALAKGAYLMCDLIELGRSSAKWSQSAATVHLNAIGGLRLLEDANQADAEPVLAGLRLVTAKLKAA